jgi:hypothetical protein
MQAKIVHLNTIKIIFTNFLTTIEAHRKGADFKFYRPYNIIYWFPDRMYQRGKRVAVCVRVHRWALLLRKLLYIVLYHHRGKRIGSVTSFPLQSQLIVSFPFKQNTVLN